MKYKKLIIALSELSGEIGRNMAVKIAKEGIFTKDDYEIICMEIKKNKANSIIKYFGIVHYFYIHSTHEPTDKQAKP